MKPEIQAVWKYLLENLFCEKTGLFYDFIDVENRGAFGKYLPAPEYIEKCIPNPCGWGTGMEDGVINGGCMLEAAIAAYGAQRDETLLSYAKKFFAGLKTCASVSESEGFLARSVSPADGKSHYIDSSRDQYTHWVSAAAAYYESGLADEAEKAFIREALRAFAARCRKNVTPETGYNLLREDGGRGMVVGMWNVMPHEAMRLPMLYLAAWKIGGAEEFAAEYWKYRDAALEKSEEIDFASCSRVFALNQMQISLRFVYDHDDDAAFRERCLALMRRCAEYGLEKAIAQAEENAMHPERLNDKARPWNQTLAAYRGCVDGYVYYVPAGFKITRVPEALQSSWLVRDVGDAAALYTALPGAVYSGELMRAIEKTVAAIDFSKHTSDAPIYLLGPYHTLANMADA